LRRPLDAIAQLLGVQFSGYSLGRLHPGDDCAVQTGRCGRDMFVVREHDDLEVLRKFVEELESLVGATVVERDQRVVEDERQRWFTTSQASRSARKTWSAVPSDSPDGSRVSPSRRSTTSVFFP
jgi:hypothetical protein